MGFEYVKELPSPQVVKELIPVNEELANIKRERDKEIADIITGDSSKFLAIVGPCSATMRILCAITHAALPRFRKK